MCVLSIKVPIRKKSGNLFNNPRIYIYIYRIGFVVFFLKKYIYIYIYIYIYYQYVNIQRIKKVSTLLTFL